MPTMCGSELVSNLDSKYPRIRTPLEHRDVFQLLIATILSAQCTDAQVNKVTRSLFEAYPDPKAMSKAKLEDLRRLVKSTGFFKLKSRRIRDVSRKLVEEFDGRVPDSMERLLELPGVGRKTANIVLSAGFAKTEGIAVDTHVKRLAKRIGLSIHAEPDKIEKDLMEITPRELWPRLSLLLILHGRKVCHARNPECPRCALTSKCLYYKEVYSKIEE